MRVRTRSFAGAMGATLVLAGVLTSPATAGSAPAGEVAGIPGFDVPAIDWTDCPDGGDGDVECGTVAVPLDWSNPNGPKTSVGIARRKATNPDRRIGTLLWSPGGPGSSGVLGTIGGSSFTDAVDERFDVVGFDPRGVGPADQVRCDANLSDRAAAAMFPHDEAEFDQWVSLNQRLIDSCRTHSSEIVDHVDNLNTARDMDVIRAALGEEKLNYLGYSYGSLMGQHYAELFPHRIRAMVNDGNIDHSITTTLEFMRKVTAATERNFLAFAEWCDNTPNCALHGRGTAKVYGELVARAKTGNLTDPDTGEPADFFDLADVLYGHLDDPGFWGKFAEYLKAFADGTGNVRTLDESRPDRAPIWCSDWRLPIKDYAEFTRLRDTLAREFPTVQWSGQIAMLGGCVGEPIRTTNPQRPLDIEGAPPLVMIGNRHDSKTPYRWTETAAEQSGSRLITYEGWGHTVYGLRYSGVISPCVNDAVDAYLIDLKVPEQGLSCPATEVPGSGQR